MRWSICAAVPDAATVLGLGPTQAGEVALNAAIRTAPTRPASALYTGVIYEALDIETLPGGRDGPGCGVPR